MAGISSKAAGKLENKFKYNGKEEERQEFSDGSGLEWMDYGARMYDAQIGSWNHIDSKSEKALTISPYSSFNNNPLNFVDPDGQENIPAIIWALKNLLGIKWGNGVNSYYDNNAIFSKSELIDFGVCYDLVWTAYMNSGDNFRNYANSGFANERKDGFQSFLGRISGREWFENGGEFHSLEKGIMNAEVGDIVFTGEDEGMEGHSSLVLSLPTFDKSTGYVEMFVLTSVTESKSTIKSISFIQDKNGNWKRTVGGQEFKGYGQIKKEFWSQNDKSSKRKKESEKSFWQSMHNKMQEMLNESFEIIKQNPKLISF